MAKHKNLVFIFADQQRYDTLACYGNDWINTPNLNALSEESFVFERAYVAQPVCAPARVSIMTGLFPHTGDVRVNGTPMPDDVKTIAEHLPDGYATGYMGKWHLGHDTAAQHGFDHWVSVGADWCTYVDDGNRSQSDFHDYLVERGYEPDTIMFSRRGHLPEGLLELLPEGVEDFSVEAKSECALEDQMAHYLGRNAAEFIKDHSDEPFVLYVSTFEPHSPYNGPYNDMYDAASLPTGPAFLRKPEDGTLRHRLMADHLLQALDGSTRGVPVPFNDTASIDGWKRLRAQYFANITLVDDMVGMITDALKEEGIFDDTVVVFTSEHGEMLGDHGLLQKLAMYEESARVPMLIRAPNLSTDKTLIGGNFSHIDLVPTLLDLLGFDVPNGLEGKPVTSVMEQGGNLRNNEVIIEWNGMEWIEFGPPENRKRDIIVDPQIPTPEIADMNTSPRRAIVFNDWKLNLCASDRCQLFNLREDPHELNNLYDDPGHQDVVRLLTAKIRAWQFRTGDTVPL